MCRKKVQTSSEDHYSAASVAQEVKNAPLRAFSQSVLPADPLCCWVPSSHCCPLLHHLQVRVTVFNKTLYNLT